MPPRIPGPGRRARSRHKDHRLSSPYLHVRGSLILTVTQTPYTPFFLALGSLGLETDPGGMLSRWKNCGEDLRYLVNSPVTNCRLNDLFASSWEGLQRRD